MFVNNDIGIGTTSDKLIILIFYKQRIIKGMIYYISMYAVPLTYDYGKSHSCQSYNLLHGYNTYPLQKMVQLIS